MFLTERVWRSEGLLQRICTHLHLLLLSLASLQLLHLLPLLTLVRELSGERVLIFGAISLDGSFECLHRLWLGVKSFVSGCSLETLVANKLGLIGLTARRATLRIAATNDLLLLKSSHILLILVACLRRNVEVLL